MRISSASGRIPGRSISASTIALRRWISMASKTQLVVGLDAGSSRTRCVICALEGGFIRYLGHGLAPAQGWAKGRVTDQDAVAESIRAAVTDAERGAQVSVEAVTVGVGGMHVHGAHSRGLYEFGRPREVDAADMAYAVELASEVRLERDRLVLHLAHLAVEETVFEPMAAAYACLTQEIRARCVALLDMGLDSTDLVVYDGEALLLASSIPIWADHFTRDVASVFKVTYEDAECLKQQYGCALLGLTADSSLIEVPSPEGRPPREARRSDLYEILEARAEELFHYVRAELQRVGMERNLLEGIVLSGGGALLNGMCDMAERVLNCQAGNALATENDIGEWPEELKSPLWTTAAGLAMYSGKLKLHRPPRRRMGGLMGLVLR